MSWTRSARKVWSGGQKEEVVEAIDDVLGLDVFLGFILRPGQQRAVHADVGDCFHYASEL